MSARFSAAPYYTSLLLPVAMMLGVGLHGAWLGATVFLALGVVPILDAVLPRDDRMPSRDEIPELEDRWSFRIVLYVFVALQTAALLFACMTWASVPLAWWEQIAIVVNLGIVTGGLGITIAHELGHRQSSWERFLGYVLLAEVGYLHFMLEHVAGHHRNVGLREDPATARRNEPVYTFFVRSVVGGWFHAWTLEADRLQSLGLHPAGPRNRMVLWMATPLVMLGAAIAWWGWTVALLLIGQALVAVALLELVNYVEHYGLVRLEISPGIRDRVRPSHAWESRFAASNVMLFKLQRHADHHVMPQRRYQSLGLHDESPQLPQGYPAMVMLALIPPLWRRVIHPLLDASYKPHA